MSLLHFLDRHHLLVPILIAPSVLLCAVYLYRRVWAPLIWTTVLTAALVFAAPPLAHGHDREFGLVVPNSQFGPDR